MKYQSNLTQDRLKTLYSYSPSTGEFVSKIENHSLGWKNYGYLHFTIDGVNYKAHRLAFLYINGKFPTKDIDHINHIRDDNRWENLREVATSTNNKNLSMNKNNKSGINGVSWSKSRNRWCVYGSKNNKTIGLGRYKTLEEAKKARMRFNADNEFHENHGKRIT